VTRRDRGRRRRILVASTGFLPWDLGAYLVHTLEQRGEDVVRYHYPFGTPRAVASRGLVAATLDQKPAIVIGLRLRGIDPHALDDVRRLGVFAALWYVDCFTERTPGWVAGLGRRADLLAVTAHGMVPNYERAGVPRVVWVPEGVYLPAFRIRPLPASARSIYGAEIAFVGGVFQPPVAAGELALRRWHLLDRLGRRFDVKVWGPQNETEHTLERGFPRVTLIRWPAYNEELVKICRTSAIILGINTVNSVYQYFSNRTFLTLACGGFHVTHYVPGLEELFENHRHLVWFRSDDECMDLCGHYLKRPAARWRIAAEGQRLVRRRWSMTRQASRLLSHIEDARAGG
jgi:hypothetical protein